MNLPPGLVYSSARFSSAIFRPFVASLLPERPHVVTEWLFINLKTGLGLLNLYWRLLPSENAENCAQLAEAEPTADTPAYKRYKRMEEAWRALAEEQEWLDGEVPPVRIAAPAHNTRFPTK